MVLPSFASISALIGSVDAAYPEFPYPNSNYDERYRGQYHFSSKGGWMNDINGLWYDAGVYHLTYQHYPHSLEWNTMHWGHATSTDLVHWVQQPIMLEPDDNVPGDCWSGSVVVDVNNTSGLKTGANNVYVAIYTATKKGTCLAYSNDKGATWQSYSGNPVKPGNEDPRDPKVFWHTPTSKWVMLLYENDGTTFYTSTNLKTWTYVSSFAWGYECPDFYVLAIDDGATKKWVLNDASGNYYIGTFNGTKFTPDAGGPWLMDVGPDFYAPQTYYRPTFPDTRVVQIAWLDNWEGDLNTSPWRKDATFPCELKLKTFTEGVRLTRYPLAEISSLYGSSQQWQTQTLSSGQNLLSGIASKCYDLSAEFDLTGATATQITFTLANKTVAYNITSKQLLGKSLAPINNRVKIRILGDWSQLEVFGNEGRFSWSENFGFTPFATNLGLTANGNVTLVSMSFNQVKRIWDGATATKRTPVASNTTPSKPVSARVFDARGRLVSTVGINNDGCHLPTGVLVMKLSNGRHVVRTKIPAVK